MSKCKVIEEAVFYLGKCITEGWSRSVLEDSIQIGLYKAQGSLPSNFAMTLPASEAKRVKQVLKDPYDFGFLKLPNEYKERDLKDALTQLLFYSFALPR